MAIKTRSEDERIGPVDPLLLADDVGLGKSFVALGYVRDEEITSLLSRQYGVPSINLDHFEVDPSEVQPVGIRIRVQFDCPPLISEFLRVGEREMEEAAQARFDRLRKGAFDGTLGKVQRLSVGGKHARRAAIGIARKLIEQDEQGERPIGRFFPGGQATRSRRFMGCLETLAERGIEGLVLGKPAAGARLAPEREHVVG